eukprot:m.96335 g.96335  ORF g.96335 m.96335 type:complete len:745 (+) comp13540_c0_seq4:233-2467(+)
MAEFQEYAGSAQRGNIDEQEDETRQNTITYFSRVEQMVAEPDFADQDEEQRDIFVNNVLEEVQGKELRILSDMLCSRVLEKILQFCSPDQLSTLLVRCIPILDRIAKNRCASHVLQTMLVRLPLMIDKDDVPDEALEFNKLLQNDESEEEPDPTKYENLTPSTIFFHLCAMMEEDLETYIRDPYGSHILQASVFGLAGLPPAAVTRSKASKAYRDASSFENPAIVTPRKKARPEFFQKSLNSLTNSLMTLPEFRDKLVIHPTASPVIQCFLSALAAVDEPMCSKLIKEIMPTETDSLLNLVQHRVGSHLVEKLLGLVSEELLHKVYVDSFRGKLQDLSQHSVANFVVAKLFEFVKSSEDAALMLDEIINDIEYILADNHGNLVVRMVEASARCKVRQKEIMKGLTAAFHIETSEHQQSIVTYILTMETADKTIDATSGGENKKAYFDLQGSRILQALVSFDDPVNKQLINSLLNMTEDMLKDMACNAVGSRVLEAFASSKMDMKRRKAFNKKLIDSIAKMAMDQYGSHVIDKMWTASDLNEKEKLATELLKHENDLNNNFYGRKVLRNCRMNRFKAKKEDWKKTLTNDDKKKKMFEEFYDENSTSKKESKKRKIRSEEGKRKERKTEKVQRKDITPDLAALGYGERLQEEDVHIGEVKLRHGGDDEIDDVFKTTKKEDTSSKKKKKKKDSKNETTLDETASKDTESSPKKKKRKKEKKHGLEKVLAAVTATKKHKKKSKKSSKG